MTIRDPSKGGPLILHQLPSWRHIIRHTLQKSPTTYRSMYNKLTRTHSTPHHTITRPQTRHQHRQLRRNGKRPAAYHHTPPVPSPRPPPLLYHLLCAQHHPNPRKTPRIFNLQPLPHRHPPRRRNKPPPDHHRPRTRQLRHVTSPLQTTLPLHSQERAVSPRSHGLLRLQEAPPDYQRHCPDVEHVSGHRLCPGILWLCECY